MPKVVLDRGALRVGSTRVPLLMGEVHYWRLSPHRWRAVLEQCRALGLEMIATYVPWQYHELARGRFDFTGRTEDQRNLVGFLDLVHELGLHLFIRPGPYIYSEWTNAGVPDRVVRLPRIGGEYRREAIVWMAAVTKVLLPYFATSTSKFRAGGPIVLFQPDNEMDVFTHWFEAQCGLDGERELHHGGHRGGTGSNPALDSEFSVPSVVHPSTLPPFHRFLHETYGNARALNRAWGTDYANIDQAQPYASRVNSFDPLTMTRARDFWRFQHWATATALKWHIDEYRRLGVKLPMVANYYPGGDVQNWRVLADSSGADFLGIDWYPRNEFTGPPAPPGASGQSTGGGGIFGLPPRREHRCFVDSCRYQSSVSPIAFIAELECGVWHGYHDYTGAFSPNHYRLLAFSALMAGIKGWNWYMFVGRDNWYFTPVNERADARPELAEVFLDIHRVYRELDPPTLQRLTSSAAYFDPAQIGTDDLLGNNPVLQALYDADIDTEFADHTTLGAGNAPPLLFYAAADWLPRESQELLDAYMQHGGTLVLFRSFPQRNENFAPFNGLEVAMPDRVLSHLGKKLEVALGSHTAVADGAPWVWDKPPGSPIVGTQIAGRQQAVENADKWMTGYIGRQWKVGYRQKRGQGSLVVIGLPVNADLVRAVHRWLGAPLYSQTDSPAVNTALFRRAGSHAREYDLLATNMGIGPVTARVSFEGVTLPARVRVTDLCAGTSRVTDRDGVYVEIPRASGTALRISPAR